MCTGSWLLNGDTPLFVVDGFARPLEYINLSEIESISVLKDGAATALWGGRGANGVVLITTKRGMYSKKEIKVDYKFGLGLPVNQPEFADAYTYAKARNEALRYDGLQPDMDEASFLAGGNRDLYPNVDWQKKRCAIIRPVINWILLSAEVASGFVISVSSITRTIWDC